jgi:hypothetical protein
VGVRSGRDRGGGITLAVRKDRQIDGDEICREESRGKEVAAMKFTEICCRLRKYKSVNVSAKDGEAQDKASLRGDPRKENRKAQDKASLRVGDPVRDNAKIIEKLKTKQASEWAIQ